MEFLAFLLFCLGVFILCNPEKTGEWFGDFARGFDRNRSKL